MTQQSLDKGLLPRWRNGVIRLIDIAPDERGGTPMPGTAITTAWLDVPVHDGQIEPNDEEAHIRHGVLEDTQGETGGYELVVDDRTFQAVMPYGARRPICFAGYNQFFLHSVLGGFHEQPPWQLCLYRLARVFGLGNGRDFSLEALARGVAGEDWDTSGAQEWYDPPCAQRVIQGRLVLDALLRLGRPNMLVALSKVVVEPPPVSEPFGKAPGWIKMPDTKYTGFE